jgi:hypothetical protein
MRTYNFWTHWVTTDEIIEWSIESFEVTPEQAILIDEWASIVAVDGVIEITPEITPE